MHFFVTYNTRAQEAQNPKEKRAEILKNILERLQIPKL